MKRDHPRILSLLIDQPWAITQAALETVLEIVQRPAVDLEAVAARMGRPLDNAQGNLAETRGRVAILGIEGPIFRYANLFTSISGATSVEALGLDLQTALDAPNVQKIVLNINSPGGQVDGINELANMIRAANQRKPVTAYVNGLAASAGYWLASAAGRVVVDESSFLGSIGVVAAVSDNRAAQERQGVKRYEIVSSLSPRKRPDPATEEGRAQILEQVDSLAALFIDRVASFRSVTADKVTNDFGRGGVLPARLAIQAGMADSLGSFESLIAELNSSDAVAVPIYAQEEPMAQGQPEPAPAAPAATTPVPTTQPSPPNERARIAAILTSAEARGREELARHLAFETDHDPEACRRILATAPTAAPVAPANPLAAAMSTVLNPSIQPGADSGDDTAQEVQAVLRFVPKQYLRAS